jgi:pimeloyl-ACP methyl ester carboxylesterase
MWDGFELPGEVRRHQLPGDLAETVGEQPAALVGASYGGLLCLQFAAEHPALVTDLVLMDAPLPDHDWSKEMHAYADEEERLLAAGDLDAAAELDVSYWAPTIADRVRPMARRALERPEEDEPGPIDLGAVRTRTLVVVGENDKPDFHLIAARLARELPDAEHAVIAGAGHLPALERPRQTAELVSRFLHI